MGDVPEILKHHGRRVVAGKMTAPCASTAAKGWRGVMVEHFPSGRSDFTGVFDNHGITLYLNGCVDLYQQIEGKHARRSMRPGSMIVSPAGIPKRFQYDGGGDFLVLHVAPQLITQVAAGAMGGDHGNVEILNEFCTRDPEIQRLTLRLWNEYLSQDIASGICAEAMGMQLAIQLLRKHSTLRRAAQSPSGALSRAAYERAVDYIEANLANDLTIHGIANELSMSASHFAHSFKETTGVAPHRYVMERRIESAKGLLRDTAIPIATLSTRVGFSTHSHFCVMFQRLTGQTPSAYRGTRTSRGSR